MLGKGDQVNGGTAIGRGALFQLLRDGIFRGNYAVGSRLREEEIAASIDTSRSPVRGWATATS
jgi:DNA-binding GntR family transcriptional regulator